MSVVCIALSSCVTNNGDIGRLYGVWVLESMKVDGEVYDGWQTADYPYSFFQFQGDMCYVTRTNDRYDYENKACTWQWINAESEISLNFTHTDTANPEPGGWAYDAPKWLLLTEPAVYSFAVEWVNDKQMVWTTVNTQGQKLTYYLKKNY